MAAVLAFASETGESSGAWPFIIAMAVMFWVVTPFLVAWDAKRKGLSPTLFFVLSWLLGPIGMLVLLELLPPGMGGICPKCGCELSGVRERRCPECGHSSRVAPKQE